MLRRLCPASYGSGGRELSGSYYQILDLVTYISYSLGGPPHPVTVTIMDNRDYIRVLLYSYYTTIKGWGVLLTYMSYNLNSSKGYIGEYDRGYQGGY